MEKYIKGMRYKPLTTRNVSGNEIDCTNWKEVKLCDYFEIQPGKYHYPEEYE